MGLLGTRADALDRPAPISDSRPQCGLARRVASTLLRGHLADDQRTRAELPFELAKAFPTAFFALLAVLLM